ncbi:MAG: hypothetical protein ACRDAT_01905 [Cetobacterium sp.]
MDFNQVVVREFLKLNPSAPSTPDVIADSRKGTKFTAAMNYPRTETAEVAGAKVISAEVPDLAKLFKNVTPSVAVYKPADNRDIAKALFDKYGIVADTKEITATAIVYDPLPLTVDVVAVSNSKTITGRVTVNLSQEVKDLTEIITVTEVDGVTDDYPTAGQEKFLALKYFYGIDFTEHREWLHERSPISITYEHSRQLANILNTPKYLSPVEWTFDTFDTSAHPYNAFIESIVYNGPTSGSTIANPSYTHVLHLKLKYANGVAIKDLLLHYDWRP